MFHVEQFACCAPYFCAGCVRGFAKKCDAVASRQWPVASCRLSVVGYRDAAGARRRWCMRRAVCNWPQGVTEDCALRAGVDGRRVLRGLAGRGPSVTKAGPDFCVFYGEGEERVNRTPGGAQCSSQFTVHSSQFTVHSSQFTVHSSQFLVHSSQLSVFGCQVVSRQLSPSRPGSLVPVSLEAPPVRIPLQGYPLPPSRWELSGLFSVTYMSGDPTQADDNKQLIRKD